MYLEKLEIQGFKSFANKNKLIFPGDIKSNGKHGLTAIVGPNGSGKSNIADAIRWVLGEQSLKTLRGKKSEDVIFSGSDKKSQLGMAEVSLFLNNSGRQNKKSESEEILDNNKDANGNSLSPLDYDEIVITRRLFRSGESEYLINGNRVRLADIQIMLAKSNVGQKTYSVIGQGMVENFLNTGAAERKDFFDEATGVKQFQIKRDQSLNKLESSYSNLQQVEMLLAEIKPRLKMLNRQVEKLKKRSQLESELKTKQLSYYSQIWQEIVVKIENYNTKLKELQKNKKIEEEKLVLAQSELTKIKDNNNDQNDNLSEIIREQQNKKNAIVKNIARLNAEIELQLEAQGQFDAAWLNKRLEELKSEQQTLEKELHILEQQKPNNELTSVKEKLEKIQSELEEKAKIKNKSEQKLIEKDRLIKQIDRLDAFLEANLEAKGHYDVAWLNNKRTELEKALTKLKTELDLINVLDLQNEIINLNTQKQKLDSLINSANIELSKLNQELKNSGRPAAGREEINRSIESFLQKLEDIKKENDLNKIKQLIAEAKSAFKQQISTLIDGEISDKLEQAKNLQASIIANSEARQELINTINTQQLALSTKQEQKRLLQIRQQEILTEQKEIEEKITKSKNIIDANIIKSEKEELYKKLHSLEAEIIDLQNNSDNKKLLEQQAQVRVEQADYFLKTSALNDKIKLYQEQILKNKKEELEIQGKIEKGKNAPDVEKIKAEKNIQEQELNELDKTLNHLEEELRQNELLRQKEKQKFFAYQENIQSLQNKINQLSEEIGNFQIKLTREETRQEDLLRDIEEEKLAITDIKNYPLDNTNIDEQLRQKINNLKNQLEMIGGIDPETEKEFLETNDRHEFLSKQTNDLNTAIDSLEKVIAELDENIKERFEKEFKVISEKFGEYFKILFNGGQAKIFKLENIDDEESQNNKEEKEERSIRLRKLRKYNSLGIAGIEIQATPPGKKIQSISMLSGGERALTAIALICAIISANPSPFVVLDEVDAALDEANSERLAQILEDLSSKTQFISITHNRASMRKASVIYGVTMKSDGVSQLLSIRLDQVAAFKDQ
jgi:chromosome segregation protein